MKKRRIISLFMVILMMVSSVTVSTAKASASSTLLNAGRTSDKTSVKIGETVNLSYNIEPQPIESYDNLVARDRMKDIVLVFDTSVSMNETMANSSKTRLEVAKEVAINFVNKFTELNDNKARIEIVEYNKYAVLKTKNFINVNSSNKSKLIAAINGLRTDYNSNTGDGLRLAYSELQNAIGQDKYIVLLTDGEANTFSVNGSYSFDLDPEYQKYFNENYYMGLGFHSVYGSFGEDSPYGLNYAKKVASQLIAKNEKKINTFIIGLGNSTGVSNNKEIANAAVGTYYEANDANTVSSLYDKIQSVIRNNIVGTVNFGEAIPDGLSVVNQDELFKQGITFENGKLKGSFPVLYSFSDDQYYYQAAPITFNVQVQGTKDGTYTIGANDTSFADITINNMVSGVNTQKIIFSQLSIVVGATSSDVIHTDNKYMDINRTVSNDYVKINDQLKVTYNITPNTIPSYFNFNGNNKTKDIVLVIDTSGSMNYVVGSNRDAKNTEDSRLDIIKGLATQFIDKFSTAQNTKISIVSYSDVAYLRAADVASTDTGTLKSKIASLDADGGTNTGDALRRIYYLLNAKPSIEDKFIVLMTDGQPSFFSTDVYNQYVTDNRNSFYINKSNDFTRGNEYANLIAQTLIGKSNFKNFIVGFGDPTEVSSNKQIADYSNGKYYNAQKEETLANVLNEIQGSIEANLSGKITFNESIPAGFTVANAAELSQLGLNLSQDGRTLTGTINVDYKLDQDKKNFTAEPLNIDVILQANTDGKYVLGENNTSKVSLDLTSVSNAKIQETQYFKPIELTVQALPKVELKVLNTAGVIDDYLTTDKTTVECNKIAQSPLAINKDSYVNVMVDGSDVNYFSYKIITENQFPTSGWSDLISDGSTTFTGIGNIPLPNQPGTYYIAYQTGNRNGTTQTVERKGIYGPFVRSVDPALSFTVTRNFENNKVNLGDTAKLIYTLQPNAFEPKELYPNLNNTYPPYEFSINDLMYHDVLGSGLKVISNSSNLTVNGQDVTLDLSSINKITYNYNEETKKYEADPITFQLLISSAGNQVGTFSVTKDGETPKIQYTEITPNGSINKKINITDNPSISFISISSYYKQGLYVKKADNKYSFVEKSEINATNKFITTAASIIDINNYQSTFSVSLPINTSTSITAKLYKINSNDTLSTTYWNLENNQKYTISNFGNCLGRYIIVYTIKPLVAGMKKDQDGKITTTVNVKIDQQEPKIVPIKIRYLPKVK